MARSPWRRLVRAGWLFAALAVGLASLSWIMLDEAGERGDVGAVQRVIDNDVLARARLAFERASVGLLADRLLTGTGQGESDPVAVAKLVTTLQTSYAQIEAIADGEGPVATLAVDLVEAIDPTVVAEPLDNMAAMYDAVDDVRWATNSKAVDDPFSALFELGFFAALPEHVLVEGLVAVAETEELTVAPDTQDLYDAISVVVAVEGGWFGPDDAAPLTDSKWFDVDHAVRLYPAQTREMQGLFSGSDVLVFDRWLEDFPSDEQLPGGIDGMRAAVLAVRDEVTPIVDEIQATETALELERARNEADQRSDLRLAALASALGAVAMAALATVLLIARRRSVHQLSRLALRDALTGASTRHALDQEVRERLDDPRFGHHVLVIIDLDRFKMVNDAFGHAVGDQLLREVASRLRSAADMLATATPGAHSSVVRMGGDEFMLATHAPTQVRTDLLVFELDAARSRSFDVTVEGRVESLLPEFSFGLAEERGTADLDAMMAAADLAAYADKASRSTGRREADRNSSPAG